MPVPPVVEGSWFELWHPLHGATLPTLSDLVARADERAAEALWAAGRIAALRHRRETEVEAARRALSDATQWDLSPRAPIRRVEPVDLYRALVATAPDEVCAHLGGSLMAEDLAAVLAAGAWHVENAPGERVEALEVGWAREWALKMARQSEERLDVPALLTFLGSRLVWDLAAYKGGRFPFIGPPLVLPDAGPAWIGPRGLLAAAESAGPDVVLVGGAHAPRLAATLSERSAFDGGPHAGHAPLEVPSLVRNEPLRDHGVALRLSTDPDRRRFRDGSSPIYEIFPPDRLPGERRYVAVAPDRVGTLHRAYPETSDWPHVPVPDPPSEAGLLLALCLAAGLTRGADGRRVNAGRVIDAYARAAEPDAVAATQLRLRQGDASHRVAPPLEVRLLRGGFRLRWSLPEGDWIAAHAGTLDDLALVMGFVDGLPGAAPTTRERRPRP